MATKLPMGVLCSHVPAILTAQEDMAGSSGHAAMPRIAGSVIVAYTSTDFADGELLARDAEGAEAVHTDDLQLLYVVLQDAGAAE